MNFHPTTCLILMLFSTAHLKLQPSEPLPKVEIDFNTLANYGMSSGYKCENGSKITIGDEKYISLGPLGPTSAVTAITCKVRNAKTNKLKAIKIIRFVAPEDRFRVAFASKKEAEIHLSLRDVEEVVKLDSWMVIDKSRVMVMDYVDAVEWPKTNLLKIWRKMLTAVAAIHAKGVLHLDLHLKNILLNEKGDIKIIDFGQSAYLQDVINSTICINKFKLPIPHAAPEYLLKCKVEHVELYWSRQSTDIREDLLVHKLKGSKEAEMILEDYDLRYQVGPPSDVWSLCSSLYQLMYGLLPSDYLLAKNYKFPALYIGNIFDLRLEHYTELFEKKVKFEFPPYVQENILLETVMKCLVRKPKDRPTIQELVKMLENVPSIKKHETTKTFRAEQYREL